MSFTLKPSVSPSLDVDQAADGVQVGRRKPFGPDDDRTTFAERLNLLPGRTAADPQGLMGNELQLADLRSYFNGIKDPNLLRKELNDRGYKDLPDFDAKNPVLDPAMYKRVNLQGA